MEFVVLLPTLTYDALGRRVEDTGSGVAYDFLYKMDGSKLAVFECCSLNYLKLSLPLPGGGSAVYNWSGLSYYRHPDWLGTTRLATSPGRGVVYDGAVPPFGEAYAQTGNIQGYSFTGQEQEAALDLFDFAFREYHTTQGRWISPDPAGLGAVDPADPQTWNRYAYVRNNPLNTVDPWGLMQSQDTGNDRCTLDGATGTLNCSTLSTWYVVPFISINCASLAQFLLFNGAGGSGLPAGCQSGTPGWQVGPARSNVGGGSAAAQAPNNGTPPDNKTCASRLAAGVQKNTGATPTNLQYTGTVGGHANYTFDVTDPTGFQSILNQNMPWSWAGPLDEGHRYGIIQSTHILDPLNGAYSGHTDLFNGHSILAPLHWIVDVGIGHIPGVNLDFGCKAGS